MQKLFEFKILRTDTPYKLRFTDEFNESINLTREHYDNTGFVPSTVEFVGKCVYHHLYHKVNDENDELVIQITDVLLALRNAKLIDYPKRLRTETT